MVMRPSDLLMTDSLVAISQSDRVRLGLAVFRAAAVPESRRVHLGNALVEFITRFGLDLGGPFFQIEKQRPSVGG
jgi:hypothetical protein